MKIEIPELKVLLLLLLLTTLALLLSMYLVYLMVAQICDESEVMPFRYESQGLFGTLTKIKTTPENADGYAKICVSTGNPTFWNIAENMDYLIKNQANPDITWDEATRAENVIVSPFT